MTIQGSPEWFAERAGKVTASRIGDMLATIKSGWAASRANYAAQLVAERLTGEVQESFTNAAMKWGTETEPHARAAYRFYTDLEVEEVGFVMHPKIPMAGASPDGLVSTDGLVEIKCPNTATHIETLQGQAVPTKYHLQMQWQMACTGRRWCDFASFDPRMPEEMQLFVKRLPRDDVKIAEIEREVVAFLSEIDATVDRLQSLYQQVRAA